MTTARAKGNVQADVPRHFWAVKEFAATTGVSIDTTYRLIRDRKLAAIHIGGEWRIPNSEIERLLAEAYERVAS